MLDIWEVAAIAAKVLLYTSLSGATGLVLVRIVFVAHVTSLERRLRSFALVLTGVAFAATTFSFLLRGAALTGDVSGMSDPEMLGLLLNTSVGDVLFYRLIGIALLFVGLFIPKVGVWVTLTGSLIALWSFAQIGHIPELDQTGIRLLLLLHLIGISFWIGILAPLRWLARDPEKLAAAADLGHRFGVMASGVVLVLVLAGGLMAWLILGSISLIFSTTYGVTLVGKVALVALLLGLAAANKFRFIPAMQGGDHAAAKHLVRSVEIETFVITAVLGVTATLTSVLALPM